MMIKFHRWWSLRKNRSKQLITTFVVALTIFVSTLLSTNPAVAVDNGRMGGSFGRSSSSSSRPTISRSVGRSSSSSGSSRSNRSGRSSSRSSSNHRSYSYSSTPKKIIRFDSTGNHHQNHHHQRPRKERRWVAQRRAVPVNVFKPKMKSATALDMLNPIAAGFSTVFIGGIIGLFVVKIDKFFSQFDNDDNDDDGTLQNLGPGISIWRLTTCHNVADPTNEKSSIIRRMERLASRSDTTTREGLQELLSSSSLELSRQLEKGTIISVESEYHHYEDDDDDVALNLAERRYNQISARERSKFDRESWSSYNGKIVREDDALPPQQHYLDSDSVDSSSGTDDDGSPSFAATYAIIQIHVVLEGDSMKQYGSRKIESKTKLQKALIQLSGDLSCIKDYVVAGEVLWAPRSTGVATTNNNDIMILEDDDDIITEQYIYANYPTLYPVDYAK